MGNFMRGIDCEHSLTYYRVVRRRDAATLLSLISQYIRPGTTIVTDSWRAYRRIALLPHGFRHLMVNHGIHFVDPITRAHTQNIENRWKGWKLYVRIRQGIVDRQIRSHLKEFCCAQDLEHATKFFPTSGAKSPLFTHASRE
jgi:transposase-like protein